MSKSFYFLSGALLLAIAPKLQAQATAGPAQVSVPAATVARMVAVKARPKGTAVPKPSASQRAPDPSTLAVVIGPNGERQLVRAKKRTK